MEHDAASAPRRGWLRVLSGLLVLTALALMISALGVGAGGWPWDEDGAVADGYPQRIERPYVVRDLPAKPGPLAGLVRDGLTWFAVSPHGRIWKLADADHRFDVQPALSDDGRKLAYLRRSKDGFGEYALRDLVSGDLTAFPDVSSGADGSDATYYVGEQQPAFISPDGDRVLVRGGRLGEGRNDDGLLIDSDGVRELFLRGAAYPAGWAPDGRLAWLVTPTYFESTRSPQIVATSSRGKELGRLEVQLHRPMSFSQWSPLLSPDGGLMSLVGEESTGSKLTVVSLRTGLEIGARSTVDAGTCQPSWRGDEPLATGADRVLADVSGSDVVVADPSLEATCSIWAARALDGDEHRGFTGSVFGTSTSWVSWRWREVTAGSLLILAALGFWWGGGRRGSETEHTEAAEPPMVSV